MTYIAILYKKGEEIRRVGCMTDDIHAIIKLFKMCGDVKVNNFKEFKIEPDHTWFRLTNNLEIKIFINKK